MSEIKSTLGDFILGSNAALITSWLPLDALLEDCAWTTTPRAPNLVASFFGDAKSIRSVSLTGFAAFILR